MRRREFKKLCESIRLHASDDPDDWEPAMDILMSLRNGHIKEHKIKPKRKERGKNPYPRFLNGSRGG